MEKTSYKKGLKEMRQDVLKVIVHTNTFVLDGVWNAVDESSNAIADIFGLPLSYDYLISIHDTNHLIHPDDLQTLAGMIAMNEWAHHRFSVRLIAPTGVVKTLVVNGRFAHASDLFYPSDQVQRPSLDNDLLENKYLLKTVAESEIVALSILKPVKDNVGNIRDFEWIMANNLQKVLAREKELVGKKYSEVFPASLSNGNFQVIKRVVESRERAVDEFYYEDHNIRGWFRASYVSLGNLVIVTAEDITFAKRAQRELKESKDTLEAAFNVSTTALIIVEAKRDRNNVLEDFTCEWLNNAGMEMIGYDPTGLSVSSAFPVLAKQDVFCLLVNACNQNLKIDFESSSIENESPAWYCWKAVKLNDGLLLSAENITERKQAESERATLIENSPDIITRWNKDLKLVFANTAFEHRTGMSRCDAFGKTNVEMGQPHHIAIPLIEKLKAVFVTGRSVTHYDSYVSASGEAYFFHRLVPEKDSQGQVQTVLSIARDITELKNFEHELVKNLEIAKQTESVARIGSWEFIPETNQFNWSEGMYRIFGMEIGHPVTPETYLEFATEDDRPIVEQLVNDLRNPTAFERIIRIKSKDVEKTLKVSATVLFSEQQVPVKIVGVDCDISALTESNRLKELNSKLKELDKTKTKFFDNVSHEFRTPLTLLLGPLEEVLNNGTKYSATDHAKLEMAHRNALRLQKLVNSLLDFSKIQSGKLDAIYQPTDLVKMTVSIASNFTSAIEKAGLKLIVKTDEIKEPVYVNPEMWEKIVLNLLSNALKYTHRGKIYLIIKSKKKHIQLHIKDTGIGISQGDLSRIFDRFVRIEGANARIHEGTGIGLALVKELVNIHHGSIQVKSKLNEGAEFIVSIPKGKRHLPVRQVYENTASQNETLHANAFSMEAFSWIHDKKRKAIVSSTNKSTKPLVLIVDDNADMRAYLTHILSQHYSVVSAENGSVAIEKLTRGVLPELIIADVMMPVMDGHALVKYLKNHQDFARIPVIVLSARNAESDKIEGMQFGADDYLVKPFSAKELKAVVHARINIARQLTTSHKELTLKNVELETRVRKHSSDLEESRDIIVKQKGLLQNILDAIPQMVWVSDAQGRVKFLNDRWYEYTGLTEAQCFERNAYECDIFHPSQHHEIESRWRNATEKQQRTVGEVLVRDAKGNYRWHLDISEPIINEAGEIEMWVGTFTDMHDQFHSEQQVKHTKDLLAAVFDSTAYSIELFQPVFNVSGKIIDFEWTFINKPKGLRETKNELIGKRLRLKQPLINREETFHKYIDVMETGVTAEFEQVKEIDGAKTWYMVSCIKLTDQLLVTKLDITEKVVTRHQMMAIADMLQQKNTELRAMNEELSNFAFIASHDMREPLRKIHLFTNAFQEGELDVSPRGKLYLQKILASASRMNALIEDIFAFSRISATGSKNFQNVDLNDIVTGVISDLNDRISERNANVSITPLPVIKGNALQLSQLFQNLLTNALTFQSDDKTPQVNISAVVMKGSDIIHPNVNSHSRYLAVSVTDNGLGFEMAFSEKIFLMFQRLHSSNQFPGTGMGLAICKRIMHNHKGFISAIGEPGEGATFTCYFPLSAEDKITG